MQEWNEPTNEMKSIAESHHNIQNNFQSQKDEIGEFFEHFDANYPCFWGEEVIGKKDVEDGNKFVCGIRHIQKPCIIWQTKN